MPDHPHKPIPFHPADTKGQELVRADPGVEIFLPPILDQHVGKHTQDIIPLGISHLLIDEFESFDIAGYDHIAFFPVIQHLLTVFLEPVIVHKTCEDVPVLVVFGLPPGLLQAQG